MAQTWRRNPETGCFLWDGTRGRGGRPIVYQGGQQTPASRDQWISLYGPLPRSLHLHRLCPYIECVSPYHHILQSPKGALARLGASAKLAAAVRALIRARGEADRGFGLAWQGGLAGLECHPDAVEQLARDLRTDPLVIHAAYAQLVGAKGREAAPPPDAAQRDAESLEAASKELDRLGVTAYNQDA